MLHGTTYNVYFSRHATLMQNNMACQTIHSFGNTSPSCNIITNVQEIAQKKLRLTHGSQRVQILNGCCLKFQFVTVKRMGIFILCYFTGLKAKEFPLSRFVVRS